MISKWAMMILVSVAVSVMPTITEANPAKAAARSAMKRTLAKDAARDAATVARPLRRDLQVSRYTTRDQAASDAVKGLDPGKHLTGKTERLKPLSAVKATKRYGLPAKPQVRETWRVAKGTPVRRNTVMGGQKGATEITTPHRLPPKDLVRVEPLH